VLRTTPLKKVDMNAKKVKKIRKRVKAEMVKTFMDGSKFKRYCQMVKQAVKMGSVTLVLMSCILAYADELVIPLPCYPKQLQQFFLDRGYRVALTGNEREKDTWGFIENKGTSFSVISYYPITDKDLQVLKELVTTTDYLGNNG
jgi:hypothetical protein